VTGAQNPAVQRPQFNKANQQSLDALTEWQARNIAFVPFCPLDRGVFDGQGPGRRSQSANGVIFASAVCVALAGNYSAIPQFWRLASLRHQLRTAHDILAAIGAEAFAARPGASCWPPASLCASGRPSR
jgi:hypothetical protein